MTRTLLGAHVPTLGNVIAFNASIVSSLAQIPPIWIASATMSRTPSRGIPRRPVRGIARTPAKDRPTKRQTRASLTPKYQNSTTHRRNPDNSGRALQSGRCASSATSPSLDEVGIMRYKRDPMNSTVLRQRCARLAMAWLALLASVCLSSIAAAGADAPTPGLAAPGLTATAQQVGALKITVLSTMLAEQALGEWGYAALVEVDGHKILFDTGATPELVLKNAESMHVDLADVEDVILSHNHADHVGGLISLRRALRAKNPKAMSRAHVSANIFLPRINPQGKDANGVNAIRAEYEALGGSFVMHDKPTALLPGVWFTGPVERIHPETNWSTHGQLIHTVHGDVEDNVPDDAALVFSTAEGIAVLTGCGHAGIVNIAQYAQRIVPSTPVFAVIGGLHLFPKSDETVDWTGAELKQLGVRYLLAGHCTGIEATMRLRASLGLSRRTAPVSAVGSSFTLGKGIDPLSLAR